MRAHTMVTPLSHARPGQTPVPVSLAPPYATALGRPPLSSLSSFSGAPPSLSAVPQLQARKPEPYIQTAPQLTSGKVHAAEAIEVRTDPGLASRLSLVKTAENLATPVAVGLAPAGSRTSPVAVSSRTSPTRDARRSDGGPVSQRSYEELGTRSAPLQEIARSDLLSPRTELTTQDSQAFIDGTTGFRGCALTLPKYSKRLQGQRESSPGFETFKTLESPRDIFKASENVRAVARSHSPQQRDDNRAWVPSGRSGAINDGTVSPRRSGEDRRRRSGVLSPVRSMPGLSARRPVDKCHSDLYEDAFARQQRLRDMKQHVEQVQERREQKRLQTYGQSMKEWKRLYKLKDTRSQAEREEELIKKRKDKETKKQEIEREREMDELRECTFRPVLKKKPGERGRSPRGMRGDANELPNSFSQLLDRQRTAVASLQELAAEDVRLRDHLGQVHAEYHDRIQREETQRVVIMLQDADTEGSAQQELIDRVRRMVQAGDDPEVAQRQIVEELVAKSQDEVKRRVLDAFGPIQLEAEGKLYHKRLSLVHELESIEAQVVALRGGTLVQEARDIGFEFGLAEKFRMMLPKVPVFSALRMTTPAESDFNSSMPVGYFRAHSTSSSNPTPRHSPRLLTDRGLLRPSTPRSQAATSDGPSRQSSGQQPSLSGSVLQQASERRGDADLMEASVQSSVLSLHSGAPASPTNVIDTQMGSSSSLPMRPALGTAPAISSSPSQAQNPDPATPTSPGREAGDASQPSQVPMLQSGGVPLGTGLTGLAEPSAVSALSSATVATYGVRENPSPSASLSGSRPRTPVGSFADASVMGQMAQRSAPYNVVVAQQPGAPGQQMVVSTGSATASPRSMAQRPSTSLMAAAQQHQQLQQQQLAAALGTSAPGAAVAAPAAMMMPSGAFGASRRMQGGMLQ